MAYAPNYRFAVIWIARNDSAGDDGALDIQVVSELITVVMLADMYGKDPRLVGADVVAARKGSDLRTLARSRKAA